jgi:hypothetical protein
MAALLKMSATRQSFVPPHDLPGFVPFNRDIIEISGQTASIVA